MLLEQVQLALQAHQRDPEGALRARLLRQKVPLPLLEALILLLEALLLLLEM